MIPIPSEWDVIEPLVIEQYKESPQYLGILKLLAEEADRTETARWELSNLLDIDAMVGAQLALIGKIAHVGRAPGMTEPEYRSAIKTQLQLRSSGTPEDVIAWVSQSIGGAPVTYLPEYPAAVWLLFSGPRLDMTQLVDQLPAGVSAHIGSWLAHEDDDPEPYPLFIELEDDGDWILIEDYGTADLEPEPPAPSTYAFTVSEEPLVAGALVTIAADALVALTDAGVVLADAVLGLEAVGVALASAAPGESVTILQYGTAGPFAVQYEVGQDLYLGVAGRWALVPPTGATISQRTGTSAALPGGGIGASINIQQPVWL